LLPFHLFYSNVPGLAVTPAPIWTTLWAPILAVMVAQFANNLLRWSSPRWRMPRILLGVATALGAIVLLVLIYQAGAWINVTTTTGSADQAKDLADTINMAIRFGLLASAVIWGLKGTKALYWLIRGGNPEGAFA
jgi:hypothetical protein